MCVYITGLLETAYTILKRKQRERWTKRRNTQLGNNELWSIAAREEERKKEVGRVGDKRKRQGMGGAQAERKMEGWRVYIYILHT